jgi:SAM-dependent methyltransferase
VTEQYRSVTDDLRRAYARSAASRDKMPKHDWKSEERQAFLERLVAEDKKRFLEVGAGTGQDSVFFREAGLDVVATDLTPEMVERCRAKGLDARVMDFLALDFPDGSFDAVWALNCLLHVPNADLPGALREIHRVLEPDGLFYLGVYGGDIVAEGVSPEDPHDPPRFFSFRSDEQMKAAIEPLFDIVDFHIVTGERAAGSGLAAGDAANYRFQSFTLRPLA